MPRSDRNSQEGGRGNTAVAAAAVDRNAVRGVAESADREVEVPGPGVVGSDAAVAPAGVEATPAHVELDPLVRVVVGREAAGAGVGG